MMNSRALLFVVSLASPVHGFTPSPPFPSRSQLSYIEEYSTQAIGDSIGSIESRVELAIASADLIQMQTILAEIHHWQDECTEESNQTDQECDVVIKAQRDVLIETLENKIAGVFWTTAMAVMATSGAADASTLEDQAQGCLSGSCSFSDQKMKTMLNRLEELQSACTEEGNQTNQECDIVVKAQRDVLIRKLERKIADPMAQIRSKIENEKCSLGELTDMLHFLERQTDSCTEESNQTNEECDVVAKAERDDLIDLLESHILYQQDEASNSTELCIRYKLCDPAKLAETYAELERLNNLCTEEGNQTRSFCGLDAKDQRDEMMANLEYELNLAEKIIENQLHGNVPAFQI